MPLGFLKNKTVLITGGTGSFGKSFAKFLLANSEASKIIIFSRDEFKQSIMQKQIYDPEKRLRFFIGDVRDLPRLERALHGVNIVVHAAALKQVPLLEYNPFEAVKTNILGSQNVIDAAIDQGVEKALLISTDKAVQPINLYGSTKLCAEKLFINGNSYAGGRTKFSCVRYGNVIGSRGSIVESLLKCQPGDKVCLTDERMTRFWITLEQSHNLVSFALANMEGGEIFVPKIPSMKLVDLFTALAPNSPKEIVGIRPGEKLDEILMTKEESKRSVSLEKYFVILPECESMFDQEKIAKYRLAGKKIDCEFSYASNTNDVWITGDGFKKLLNI